MLLVPDALLLATWKLTTVPAASAAAGALSTAPRERQAARTGNEEVHNLICILHLAGLREPQFGLGSRFSAQTPGKRSKAKGDAQHAHVPPISGDAGDVRAPHLPRNRAGRLTSVRARQPAGDWRSCRRTG